ncbi:MAG: LapA family protein [Mycobacterium sp.]
MSSDPPASADQPEDRKRDEAPKPPVPFTRAAALWSSLIVGFLILIVLLIFITQNTASADFQFLSFHWTLPLGVAILLAAVGGGLLTVLVGTARIYQLRRAAKKLTARR